MDFNTFAQFISSVGFPIAACVAIYLQSNRQAELHKAEMDKINEALLNNTKALTELSTIIKRGDYDE